MKNPLNKRLPRELKKEFGKYLVIFLFLVMLISVVSGFLVSDISVIKAYDTGFKKYNIEWGHITFSEKLNDNTLKNLEKENNIKLYDLEYKQEEYNDTSIRVYKNPTDINLECVLKGSTPSNANEIALDRMYAELNNINVGDTITLAGKELTVSAYIALPNYSCMFEKNSDLMFDANKFSIAIMTEEGYGKIISSRTHYNYGWIYNDEPSEKKEEKKMSDELLKKTITYLYMNDPNISVNDFLPRYLNKAITFTREDMGSDKAFITLFTYIVIIILAFVFGVIISNTIDQESTVIGTLRASGYTRGELTRHYMTLPIIVSLIGALVGNILGYTVMKDVMVKIYYHNYSLAAYKTIWSSEAFLETTVVPIFLMFVVNLIIIRKKLTLSPLKFIRRDLKKHSKKKALRLNTKIPFIIRFKIRVFLQNIPNYITLFFGVICASTVMIFGIMIDPLLENYTSNIESSMFCNYQYILSVPVKTDNENAEKFAITTLLTTKKDYVTDEISIYGIEKDSSYVDITIPEGKIIVSNGIMNKFKLKKGDTFKLKDEFTDEIYEFEIAGQFKYDAALSVFMNRNEFNETFNHKDDYFSGYFSDEVISDIDDSIIVSVLKLGDFTTLSNQLSNSITGVMFWVMIFGVIMFILLVYLLSKQIIEKNVQSISMTKILGYNVREIGGLYIASTSCVVVLSLILVIPITKLILNWAFGTYIYKEIGGYFPCYISNLIYLEMVVTGIICYILVVIMQLLKIRKIPMSEALKNVE